MGEHSKKYQCCGKPQMVSSNFINTYMDEFLKQNLEKLIVLQATLTKETDRGCALMAAGFLESEIEKLVKHKLVGTAKFFEDLFNYTGPLGTFAAKIKISYALGIISKSTMQNLQIIKTIRNDFAHDHKLIDFSTPKITSNIQNLKTHFSSKSTNILRDIFLNTVLEVLALIHSEINYTKRFKEMQDFKMSDETTEFAAEHSLTFAKIIVAELGKDGIITLSDEIIQSIAERFATVNTINWENPKTKNP